MDSHTLSEMMLKSAGLDTILNVARYLPFGAEVDGLIKQMRYEDPDTKARVVDAAGIRNIREFILTEKIMGNILKAYCSIFEAQQRLLESDYGFKKLPA